MRLLLDSHILVWWLAGERRIGTARRAAIGDSSAQVLFSAVSVWELGLKRADGNLEIGTRRLRGAGHGEGAQLTDLLTEEGFVELPLTAAHAERALTLPAIHRDAVDRFLIAQAMVEKLTLVTDDATIRRYPVAVL